MPAELLKLPLDGNGNESNRIAYKLAHELAIRERTNTQHGAGWITAKVGPLLEAAHVITLEQLKERGKHAGRFREYLAGSVSDEKLGGALGTLNEMGAFKVQITDDAFWADGRGWIDRFWGSEIGLYVRPIEGVTPQLLSGDSMTREQVTKKRRQRNAAKNIEAKRAEGQAKKGKRATDGAQDKIHP